MRAAIVTGKPQDYIRLEAEDLKDCCRLYEMSKGKYCKDHPEAIRVEISPSLCKFALEFILPTQYDKEWPNAQVLDAMDTTS